MSSYKLAKPSNFRRLQREQNFRAIDHSIARSRVRGDEYNDIIIKKTEPVNFAVQPSQPSRRPDLDAAAGVTAGLLGTAAIAAPVLAPAAVAAGLGYGTYKLGQSLSLW